VDAVDSSGLVMPVSVWSYTLTDDNSAHHTLPPAAAADKDRRRRRLLMLEPVNSITATVSFDSHVSLTVV